MQQHAACALLTQTAQSQAVCMQRQSKLAWRTQHTHLEFTTNQVDSEMRVLLSNLKDMVEAELAAKSGKKKKKGKGGKVSATVCTACRGSITFQWRTRKKGGFRPANVCVACCAERAGLWAHSAAHSQIPCCCELRRPRRAAKRRRPRGRAARRKKTPR